MRLSTVLPAVLALISLGGLTGCTDAPAELPKSEAPPASPRQAGQRGLDYLLASANQWQYTHTCFGCHVQGVAVMGAALAQSNAYIVRPGSVSELLAKVEHNKEESSASSVGANNRPFSQFFNQPFHRSVSGYQFTSGYHAGIALAYHDRYANGQVQAELEPRARLAMSAQLPDGSFPVGRAESPIDQGVIMATTSCLVTIYQANPADKDADMTAASKRAFDWLCTAQPFSTQDYAYKIIGLTWRLQRNASTVVTKTAQDLIAIKNTDGGWPEETGGRGSNAYATGLALYALKLAGIPITDRNLVDGTLYLLRTQTTDGSWDLINTSSRRPSHFASTMYAVVGLGGVFDEQAEEEFLSLFRAGNTRQSISIWSIFVYLAFPSLTLIALRGRRW